MVRLIVAIAAALSALASLVGSAGYAWYLHSDLFRRGTEQHLSEFIGLPSEIARIVPRSRSARQFDGVAVFLPDRRSRALFCDEALLRSVPTPEYPDDYEIELHSGTAEISTRTWLREDYRRVLESGLRPSFDSGGPRRVTFTRMDVRIERDRFRLQLDDAAGVVSFRDDSRGEARVRCRSLNGHRTADFVTLDASFSPNNGGIRLDHVELATPRLPLALLRLDDISGAPITTGDFQGRLTYRESNNERTLSFSGSCFDADLSEWSHALAATPWRGRCPNLELTDCQIVNRMLRRARFRGALQDVELGDILAPFGLADLGARATLVVSDADVSPDGIEFLAATGECRRVSLEALTRRVGWGEMTGVVDLVIGSLEIHANRLVRLDARLDVDDATENPNRISRALLNEVISRALKFSLPAILPEQILYTRCGIRFDVRDESLRLFGTHGPRESCILTVRGGGIDIPLIFEPENPTNLTPWLDPVRNTLLEHLRRRLSAAGSE